MVETPARPNVIKSDVLQPVGWALTRAVSLVWIPTLQRSVGSTSVIEIGWLGGANS
jgi:hypothetical protein